jgi:cyclomaltodextrin glucanotransferase
LYYGVEQCLHNDTAGGEDPYNRPMMASFDTSAPLYRLIQQLTDVRKTNQAIQYGSQWTQFLTSDVYCFSRRYRDSRCFVALNRGGETILNDIQADLPDDDYTCVISGRELQVRNGHLHKVHLAPHEAFVLVAPGTPVLGQVVVTIQVNGCELEPGQYVALLGDAEELGNWNQHTPLRLEFINRNTWQGSIAFNVSAGKHVAYKYAILSEGPAVSDQPIRENRTSRRRVVPKVGFAKWRDVWES